MYIRVLILIVCLNVCKSQAQDDSTFYGTAELVKNGRRSRLLSDFVEGGSSPAPAPVPIPVAKPRLNAQSNGDVRQQSTERMLKNYGNIFQMDTKNLTEKQRTLLERIVERVARLGGSLEPDNEVPLDQDNQSESRSRHRNRNVRKNVPKIDENNSATQTSTTAESTPTTKTIKRTTAGIMAHPTKPVSSSTTKVGKSKITQTSNFHQMRPNSTEVVFGNITTTSIVDSLSKDNAREDVYNRRPIIAEKANIKPSSIKPTKYHYYPHNQHIYLLPECAIQQVCNAVYVRLNYTQPLCACPARYRDPCSASINEDDLHTTKLIGDQKKKAITLAKTCESTSEMRECRSPRDWSLLALQNTRTGKSHYLVICRCPDNYNLEGPMAHDQPTYASVPGIRVFGMMCVKPGNVNNLIRKPQPPKRDHYQQSPYYQRYKKHATMSPSPEHERISRQTDFSDLSTVPSVTTNEPNDDGYTETVDTDTITSTDESQPVEDLNALPQEVQTRIKRMIDQLNVNTNSISRERRSIADNENNDDSDDVASRRSSFNSEMWPDVSWHEINKQIGDIH